MKGVNEKHEWLFNDHLARERGCDLEELQETYIALRKVLENPLGDGTHADAVEVVEILENELQNLWGFEPDPKYHSYWHEVEGCTCGSMDSRDMFGTGLRAINLACPFHGGVL